jgi:hypothetical protein
MQPTGVSVRSSSGLARTSSFRIGRETRARRVSFAEAKRATAAAAGSLMCGDEHGVGMRCVCCGSVGGVGEGASRALADESELIFGRVLRWCRAVCKSQHAGLQRPFSAFAQPRILLAAG